MTPTDQSMLKRMATTMTISFAKQRRMCVGHAGNGLNFAMTAKLQHGKTLTMKGKCNLCGTKCADEFCGGCVYYLQKKKDRSLVTARKTAPIPYLFGIRADRSKSDFFTLQTDNHYEK